MPNLLWIRRHQPPAWWEHIAAHPDGIAVALVAVVVGAISAWGIWWTPLDHAPAVASVPGWWLAGVACTLGVGGLVTLGGLLVHWGTIQLAQLVHRVGLILQVVGWWAWCAVIVAAPGADGEALAIGAGILGCGALAGIVASFVSEYRLHVDLKRWRIICDDHC